MAGVRQVLISIFHAILYICMGLAGTALIIGGVSELLADPMSAKDVRVVAVAGTLASNPRFSIYSNGDPKNLELQLNEYSRNRFTINGDALEAMRYVMMKDYLQPGDSVFLLVSEEGYKENIATEETEEYIRPVPVYGVRSSTQIYLTVENYCKKANASRPWFSIVLLFFGCLFVGAIVWAAYASSKKKQK